MGKLKLQINMSIDGFVGGLNNDLDWMLPEVDERHLNYLQSLTIKVDTILMGRQMATSAIPYWEKVASSGKETLETKFARFFHGAKKIIFSNSLDEFEGENVTIENRPLKESIDELKSKSQNDLIVYGGARFVASLIDENLIDDLNLFIHPVAIGKGLPIFKNKSKYTNRTKV